MGELNYMGCAGLAGVEACRENVRQLTMADEDLLELLPVSEPPPGFETRVLERLGHSTPGRGTTSRLGRVSHLCRRPGSQRGKSGLNRRTLAIAAAAMVAAGAGLGGWGMRSAMSSAPQVPLSSAALVSPSHRTVGEIFAYGGSSEWLYMSVDMDSWNGAVICKLVGKDGRVTTVGSFRLIGGYGSWGSPDSVDNGSLSGARLVAPDGTLLATASFHTRELELRVWMIRLSPPDRPPGPLVAVPAAGMSRGQVLDGDGHGVPLGSGQMDTNGPAREVKPASGAAGAGVGVGETPRATVLASRIAVPTLPLRLLSTGSRPLRFTALSHVSRR